MSLLVLDTRAVHILMDHELQIAQRIHETARQRSKLEPVEPRSDLAAKDLIAADSEAQS
jgi:hypothetical protein